VAKYLSDRVEQVQILPGISSVQYLFARIALDMNEVYLTSSHGRIPDFDRILQYPKVALVTDEINGPYQIAQAICARGLQRTMVIGEALSYPAECITVLPAAEVPDRHYQMNVVVIYEG
jgi:cobalt-precorrin-7 (C5)-methyltransferase